MASGRTSRSTGFTQRYRYRPAFISTCTPRNEMVDKRPAHRGRPRGTADVVAAVQCGRKHDLEIAVRCGGHGTSGQSVTDGGILIDLGLMRSVRVDRAARRA